MDIDKIEIGMENDYIACAYLFSPQHAKTRGFLENLNLSKVKQAFREKAKRYHPDLHGYDGDEMIVKRQERFIKIKKSYEHLVKNNLTFRYTTGDDFGEPENAFIVCTFWMINALYLIGETKTCIRCEEEKDFSMFSINSINKDGRALYCRECLKIIRRAG